MSLHNLKNLLVDGNLVQLNSDDRLRKLSMVQSYVGKESAYLNPLYLGKLKYPNGHRTIILECQEWRYETSVESWISTDRIFSDTSTIPITESDAELLYAVLCDQVYPYGREIL